jgi:integrase
MLKVTKRGHKLFVPDGVKTDVAIKRYQDFLSKHRSEFRDPENDYNLTFHGLRHTYAAEKFTEFAKIGKSVRQAKFAVSELLGHGRDDVTRIYLTSLKDKTHNNPNIGENNDKSEGVDEI